MNDKQTKFIFKIPDEMNDKIAQQARRLMVSKSFIVKQAIDWYLKMQI